MTYHPSLSPLIHASVGFAETPHGSVLLCASPEGLLLCGYVHQADELLARLDRGGVVIHDGPEPAPILAGRAFLMASFRGEDPGPPPPLWLRGTDLQRRLWLQLLNLPRGGLVSYAELSRRWDRAPESAAIARALRDCPLPLFVPLHRVADLEDRCAGHDLTLPTPLAAALTLLRVREEPPPPRPRTSGWPRLSQMPAPSAPPAL